MFKLIQLLLLYICTFLDFLNKFLFREFWLTDWLIDCGNIEQCFFWFWFLFDTVCCTLFLVKCKTELGVCVVLRRFLFVHTCLEGNEWIVCRGINERTNERTIDRMDKRFESKACLLLVWMIYDELMIMLMNKVIDLFSLQNNWLA